MPERESSLVEQLTPEEEEQIRLSANKEISRLRKKYGEETFDAIDAARFRMELRQLHINYKLNPSNNQFCTFEGEALYRFMQHYYGVNMNELSNCKHPDDVQRLIEAGREEEYFRKRDLGVKFMENALRMIPVWRKQQEEKPLGERD